MVRRRVTGMGVCHGWRCVFLYRLYTGPSLAAPPNFWPSTTRDVRGSAAISALSNSQWKAAGEPQSNNSIVRRYRR